MDMQALVADWTRREIPVLASTAAALAALRRDEERVSGRDISRVVLRDPLMTLRVLRYAEAKRSARQPTDITTVEHAVMMHGITRFFRDFADLPVLEQAMASDPEALQGALAVISRAQHAAAHARAMASHRADLETDEVIIGALLHDLAELLLWCLAPERMLEVRRRQVNDSTLRSRAAQEAVFGVAIADLQAGLAGMWALPELLLKLMDDASANEPRVRNVKLAVDLARHSADGWTDAALPDDYVRIADLLRSTPEQVKAMVGAQEAAPEG
jgi:HD-like signal output (HDOD) protein